MKEREEKVPAFFCCCHTHLLAFDDTKGFPSLPSSFKGPEQEKHKAQEPIACWGSAALVWPWIGYT